MLDEQLPRQRLSNMGYDYDEPYMYKVPWKSDSAWIIYLI